MEYYTSDTAAKRIQNYYDEWFKYREKDLGKRYKDPDTGEIKTLAAWITEMLDVKFPVPLYFNESYLSLRTLLEADEKNPTRWVSWQELYQVRYGIYEKIRNLQPLKKRKQHE